jgi:hypothetical protein
MPTLALSSHRSGFEIPLRGPTATIVGCRSSRRLHHPPVTSGVPRATDVVRAGRHVSKVPGHDNGAEGQKKPPRGLNVGEQFLLSRPFGASLSAFRRGPRPTKGRVSYRYHLADVDYRDDIYVHPIGVL